MLPAENIIPPSALTKFIHSYVVSHHFSGTILIEKAHRIWYAKSFGFANLPYKVPNQPTTKYKIDSITKAVTAVLILKLYEQGNIDLNKTIKTYLPNYTGEAADKVLVSGNAIN